MGMRQAIAISRIVLRVNEETSCIDIATYLQLGRYVSSDTEVNENLICNNLQQNIFVYRVQVMLA